MSKAKGPDMEHLLSDIAARYNLKRKSGKYAGACPKCGGSSSSDKFNIKDDGGFKCYSCGFKGDIITWLREMENMSCSQAHETAGIACRATYCPVVDTCRLGNGTGKAKKRPLYSVKPQTSQLKKLPQPAIVAPKDIWEQWARELVAKGEEKILEQPEVLQLLAARGIDQDLVKRFRLGWLGHDRKINRETIGLKKIEGKNEQWMPGGLLIPIIDRKNRIHRIRIRRPKSAREKFLEDLKYFWVKGSGTHPMVIRPEGRIRGAVIVEAELDAMAVAGAHAGVMVIALGTVSTGISEPLRTELHQVPVILVALDADLGEKGKPGPGAAAAAAWQSEYRQAKYWPVLEGKDPGNYAELGGDLAKWIEPGLVPEFKRQEVGHDLACSPGLHRRGDGVSETPPSVKTQSILPKSPLDQLDREPDLKWCPICFGDLFLKGERGGCFCVNCQPLSLTGKLVRATVPRGQYVIS
jgi:hypothetical protein